MKKLITAKLQWDKFNEKSKGIKAYRLRSIWRMPFFLLIGRCTDFFVNGKIVVKILKMKVIACQCMDAARVEKLLWMNLSGESER